MKKQVLSAIMAALILTVAAQTGENNRILRAGIGVFSYSQAVTKTSSSSQAIYFQTDEDYFNISIHPNVAWFVKDNLAISGLVSLSFTTGSSIQTNAGHSLTGSPGITNY